MADEDKFYPYGAAGRYDKAGTGMSLFMGARWGFHRGVPAFLWVGTLLSLVAVTTAATDNHAYTLTNAGPSVDRSFYGVGCNSHYFHLSVKSFASIWLMLNFVLFVASFAIFMKHWCFKAFTSDTVKGY